MTMNIILFTLFILINLFPLDALRAEQVYSNPKIAKQRKTQSSNAVKKNKTKKIDPEKELKSLMRKNPKDLALTDLKKVTPYAAKTKHYEFAIACVEQMLLLESDKPEQDHEVIRLLRLQLADLYFDNNEMKKAAHNFRIYIKLYPGSCKEDLAYAKYKEILCRFYLCLKPPLDQTKTYKTVALANDYLEQSPSFYINEVQSIRNNCYEYIFDYESKIILFNAKAQQATEERLNQLKKELTAVMSEFELKLIDLEIAVSEIQNKPELLAQKKAERAEKFPETKLELAQNQKKKYRDRF